MYDTRHLEIVGCDLSTSPLQAEFKVQACVELDELLTINPHLLLKSL
jgi:hypothetical protein